MDSAEAAKDLTVGINSTMKRDVRDLMVQLGNHNSKSEMLIQSETAFNAGETKNHSMDQLEALHQREHKDALYFWILEQVQDEDFCIEKEKDCANIGKEPIIASVLLGCSNGKMGVLQMDPTFHYKMKAKRL